MLQDRSRDATSNSPQKIRLRPVISGKAAMASHYAKNRFQLPNLHATVVNRMVVGNTVVDHEHIVGIQDETVEAIAVYRVEDGLIQIVWFY